MRAEPVYRRRRATALLILGAVLSAGGWLGTKIGGPDALAARPGEPVRLVVPRTQTDAAVQPVAMGADLTLAPPRDPSVVGWWRDGPLPGAAAGTAVLTGHSVHNGGGVFDSLEELRPGDVIEVATAGGTLAFRVRRMEIVDQETLAKQSAELFATDGPPRLALVTCEGWNGKSYDANVVVIATAADPPG